MPAPAITKASFSNVIAALKENGLTPVNVDFKPDGGFSIRLDDGTAVGSPAPSKPGPKRWGEARAA